MDSKHTFIANIYSFFLCIISFILLIMLHYNTSSYLLIFLCSMLVISGLFFLYCICNNIRNALSQNTSFIRDQLTQLYTLQGFMIKTDQKHHTSYSSGTAFYIAMDIKRFRMINERYGTDTGNAILQKISDILKLCFPKHAVIGRLHSDIFIIYVSHTTKEKVIQKLILAATKMRSEKPLNMEPSFGICAADTLLSVKTEIHCAQTALEEAKKNDSYLYKEFTDDMRKQIRLSMDIEQDMYYALEHKQFNIYMQPKYSIITGQIVGAESLVRWVHPQKGLIYPDNFIPLFEHNGFICKLDEYMWDATAAIIAEWIHNGRTPIPISVNISRMHTLGEELCNKLLNIVTNHHIPAKYLQLEFTESAYNDNVEELYRTMHLLHQMGFTILMDDFGSGYSSLNMLKDYPVDIIKMDKEFLHIEKNDPKGKCVISNVIRMIQDLGLEIIAEGVETEEQIAFLKECGCQVVQGYYYSPPVPYTEFPIE